MVFSIISLIVLILLISFQCQRLVASYNDEIMGITNLPIEDSLTKRRSDIITKINRLLINWLFLTLLLIMGIVVLCFIIWGLKGL
jgi:hypothetical protein